MIPSVIHYCWFGGAPLPSDAERCIASWRKYFPEWEIKRWDESNYDVHTTPYTSQAYTMRKYAFVSDYARFDILYRHGGVYFDTDVEVIRPFDDILKKGAFMGMEGTAVNPGLGIGTERGDKLLEEILRHYGTLSFTDSEGHQLAGTVVKHTTDVLRRHGFDDVSGKQQNTDGIEIYPNDFFNPFDDVTGRLKITPNTHSIHHYAKSWCDDAGPWRTRMSRLGHRIFGIKFSSHIKRLIRL